MASEKLLRVKKTMRMFNAITITLTIVFALGFIGAICYNIWFDYNSIEISAMITEIVEDRSEESTVSHYDPVIVYTANAGEIFRQYCNAEIPAKTKVGDPLRIRYLYQNPGKIKVVGHFWSNWAVAVGLFIFTAIFGGFVILSYLAENGYKLRERRARFYSKEIYADIKTVEKDITYGVDDQNPYVIVATWEDPDTGEQHLFESRRFWENPEKYIKDRKTVLVKADPDNIWNKYWMDVSFIPGDLQ
jgi:hypothetical protein